MYDLNALSPHLLRYLLKLLYALVVVCRCNSLTYEALACKAFRVSPFSKFLRGETVTVCRELTVCIRFGEPVRAHVSFDFSELTANGLPEADDVRAKMEIRAGSGWSALTRCLFSFGGFWDYSHEDFSVVMRVHGTDVLTIVLIGHAAVYIGEREAILSGLRKAWSEISSALGPKREVLHTSSWAIIHLMLTPMTWSRLLSV